MWGVGGGGGGGGTGYERKHSMIPLYGYDVARTLPVCDHDVAVTAGDQAVAKMVIFIFFTLMVAFH